MDTKERLIHENIRNQWQQKFFFPKTSDNVVFADNTNQFRKYFIHSLISLFAKLNGESSFNTPDGNNYYSV